MRNSLVITVFNESNTILALLNSIYAQKKAVDEVIIVDGGSKDNTILIVKQYIKSNKLKSLKIFVSPGNRSKGRNYGVHKSKGEIILFTDAGCLLRKDWVEKITEKFSNKNVDVVAGYYNAVAKNSFQRALIPYVLVMPDQINPSDFLPATRSMAIRREIFVKMGGFSEEFSHNEDYVFANRLKKSGEKIAFAKDAIVTWIPRTTFKSAFKMFFRFAYGDSESGLFRPKAFLVIGRYVFGLYVLVLTYLYQSMLLLVGVFGLFILYLFLTIRKNIKYTNSGNDVYMLLLMQILSDIAVGAGSVLGLIKFAIKKLPKLIVKNKLVVALVILFVVLAGSVIFWGLPSSDHPFIYHMDEWHQLNAVRSVVALGDPNVEGAAHGPMFQFFLSGIYLVPFILFKIINPGQVNSAFTDYGMQQRIFEVLRANTVLFGAGVIVAFAVVLRKYLKVHPLLLLFLIFSPIFLSLSSYFKYDIALLFWISSGVLFAMKYEETRDKKIYYIMSLLFGFALSTKISALPLAALTPATYLLFTAKSERNIRDIVFGLGIFAMTFLSFGIPSILFGKGSIAEFFYSNLVTAPAETGNILFPTSFIQYMTVFQGIFLFGLGLIVLFMASFIYYFVIIAKFISNKVLEVSRVEVFAFLMLTLFVISLVPLRVAAGGNRALVLLPPILLIVFLFLNRVIAIKNIRFPVQVFVAICLLLQIVQGFTWLEVKMQEDARQVSSQWILREIPKAEKIGLESIPIYQYIPDISLKEYYLAQEKKEVRNEYILIDSKSNNLPQYVIVSNEDIVKYIKKSEKKSLISRLNNEGYKVVARFTPTTPLFMDRFDLYIANVGPVLPVAQIAIFKKD